MPSQSNKVGFVQGPEAVEKAQDAQSVITLDRLKKFNDI